MESINKNNGINIKLDEDTAQGEYVNMAVVGHSTCEFIMDFIRVMPGVQNANVVKRLILTPEHAKRLLLTLQENIAGYENQFGEINLNNQPINNIPMGFGSNDAKA